MGRTFRGGRRRTRMGHVVTRRAGAAGKDGGLGRGNGAGPHKPQ